MRNAYVGARLRECGPWRRTGERRRRDAGSSTSPDGRARNPPPETRGCCRYTIFLFLSFSFSVIHLYRVHYRDAIRLRYINNNIELVYTLYAVNGFIRTPIYVISFSVLPARHARQLTSVLVFTVLYILSRTYTTMIIINVFLSRLP